MQTPIRLISAFVIVAFMAPLLIAPFQARAQAGGVQCAVSAIAAALGYKKGTGIAAAFTTAITAIKNKAMAIMVPSQANTDIIGQAGPPGDNLSENTGSFWANFWQNFKKSCLDPIMTDIARLILRQMRNMIINWINTGNIGGSATFVKNFEFDARKTAENAARIFASQLTGIDFCNYFPQTFRTDIFAGVNLRARLECAIDKPRAEFIADLHNPLGQDLMEQILYDLPTNDPLNVELAARDALSRQVAQATDARKTQVTSGQGFIGIEKCKTEKVVQEAEYYNVITDQACELSEDGGIPKGCVFRPAQTICTETETQTPGSFVADMATEPLKSELRQNELVKEFYEAVAAIVNAFVGKVISGGLSKTFGS